MITSIEMSSQQSCSQRVRNQDHISSSFCCWDLHLEGNAIWRETLCAARFFWTQGVWLYGSEELRGFESMEQLLLCGKDGWRVPSLAGGVWGRKAMDGWDSGWLGPLPTSTSICYSCPTPNSSTSTTAIFRAFEPPTQPVACTCYHSTPFCK